jgi:hypothetical protein
MIGIIAQYPPTSVAEWVPEAVMILSFFDALLLIYSLWDSPYSPAYFPASVLNELGDARLQDRQTLICGLLRWYDQIIQENEALIQSKSRLLKGAMGIFLINLLLVMVSAWVA